MIFVKFVRIFFIFIYQNIFILNFLDFGLFLDVYLYLQNILKITFKIYFIKIYLYLNCFFVWGAASADRPVGRLSLWTLWIASVDQAVDRVSLSYGLPLLPIDLAVDQHLERLFVSTFGLCRSTGRRSTVEFVYIFAADLGTLVSNFSLSSDLCGLSPLHPTFPSHLYTQIPIFFTLLL